MRSLAIMRVTAVQLIVVEQEAVRKAHSIVVRLHVYSYAILNRFVKQQS